MATPDRHLANFAIALFIFSFFLYIVSGLRNCTPCGFSEKTKRRLTKLETYMVFSPIGFLTLLAIFAGVYYYRENY